MWVSSVDTATIHASLVSVRFAVSDRIFFTHLGRQWGDIKNAVGPIFLRPLLHPQNPFLSLCGRTGCRTRVELAACERSRGGLLLSGGPIPLPLLV